jgi:regulatory subunit of type II PKA R-subunit
MAGGCWLYPKYATFFIFGHASSSAAFSKEVLRIQPDNIYDFAADYFADLLAQVRGMLQ